MGELIVVGERVLIEQLDSEQQTQSGLYLPATVAEHDKVRSGRIVQVGPGYLVPSPAIPEDDSDDWQHSHVTNSYIPLQAQAGDHAYFLRNQATDITWEGKKMVVVPHSAILFLVRPDSKDIMGCIDRLLDE